MTGLLIPLDLHGFQNLQHDLKGVLGAREKNEARPEAPPRKTLTKEEIAALAAQYNPGKMTQAEYDAFLEDLVAQGVLSKEELGRLGYQGYAVVGSAVFDSNNTYLSPLRFGIG